MGRNKRGFYDDYHYWDDNYSSTVRSPTYRGKKLPPEIKEKSFSKPKNVGRPIDPDAIRQEQTTQMQRSNELTGRVNQFFSQGPPFYRLGNVLPNRATEYRAKTKERYLNKKPGIIDSMVNSVSRIVQEGRGTWKAPDDALSRGLSYLRHNEIVPPESEIYSPDQHPEYFIKDRHRPAQVMTKEFEDMMGSFKRAGSEDPVEQKAKEELAKKKGGGGAGGVGGGGGGGVGGMTERIQRMMGEFSKNKNNAMDKYGIVEVIRGNTMTYWDPKTGKEFGSPQEAALGMPIPATGEMVKAETEAMKERGATQRERIKGEYDVKSSAITGEAMVRRAEVAAQADNLGLEGETATKAWTPPQEEWDYVTAIQNKPKKAATFIGTKDKETQLKWLKHLRQYAPKLYNELYNLHKK